MATTQITVDIEGSTYSGWESCEINDDLEQLGNDFTLTTNIPADSTLTIREGQAVIIYIDGEKKLTGWVDKVSISETADSSQMTVTGRDKTCDFVDSKLSNKTFTPPVGFVQIFKELLTLVGYEIVSENSLVKPLGSNKISIINNHGTIQDFATTEGIGFNSSESAYDLIRRLADKRGLVVGTNGDGDITIDDIGALTATTILQRISEDYGTQFGESSANNIITANYENSLAERYYEYKIASKTTGATNASLPAADKNKTDAQKAVLDPINNDSKVTYSATVYDADIRTTRKFYAVVPNLDNAQCKDRAKWELNIRKAKGFIYTCKVAGFRQQITSTFGNANLNALNPLWEANTMVYLVDPRYNLDGQYLIRAVKYKQSLSEGAVCELTLIDEYSYTYSTYKPEIKKGKKSTNKSLLFTDPV